MVETLIYGVAKAASRNITFTAKLDPNLVRVLNLLFKHAKSQKQSHLLTKRLWDLQGHDTDMYFFLEAMTCRSTYAFALIQRTVDL